MAILVEHLRIRDDDLFGPRKGKHWLHLSMQSGSMDEELLYSDAHHKSLKAASSVGTVFKAIPRFFSKSVGPQDHCAAQKPGAAWCSAAAGGFAPDAGSYALQASTHR